MRVSPDHKRPCRSCGAMRCTCLALARLRLVCAEFEALEAIADRARELVELVRLRGERVDGVVRLEEELARLDDAIAARRAGP